MVKYYCSSKIISRKLIFSKYCVLRLRPLLERENVLFPSLSDTETRIRPGQFLLITCFPYTYLPRPFTISEIERNGDLVINFKIIGNGTKYIASLPVGDEIKIVYPLGNGYLEKHSSEDEIIFISGGTGIFSLIPLYKKYRNRRKLKFYLGVKDETDYLAYETLFRDTDIFSKLIISTEDGSYGMKGTVVDTILRYEREIKNKYFYISGPISMIKNIIFKYNDKTKIDGEVSLEEIISCGVGACRGCVVPTVDGYKTVCADGPVFKIADILWKKMV